MGNRRLYNERGFLVKEVVNFDEGKAWHLIGTFMEGSVKMRNPKEYRIRIKPDPRWFGVSRVAFHPDRVYECESVYKATRRHVYGSGKWYISPYRDPKVSWWDLPGTFSFEEFDVVMSSAPLLSGL